MVNYIVPTGWAKYADLGGTPDANNAFHPSLLSYIGQVNNADGTKGVVFQPQAAGDSFLTITNAAIPDPEDDPFGNVSVILRAEKTTASKADLLLRSSGGVVGGEQGEPFDSPLTRAKYSADFGATTISGFGGHTFSSDGTATALKDEQSNGRRGHFINYAYTLGVANSKAGVWTTTPVTRFGMGGEVLIYFKTNGIIQTRFWCGLFASDPLTGATPPIDPNTIPGVGIMLDDSLVNNSLRTWTCNGSASTVVDTQFALAAFQKYVLRIAFTPSNTDGSNSVLFSVLPLGQTQANRKWTHIDERVGLSANTLPASISGTLSSTDLAFYLRAMNTTGHSVVRTIQFGGLTVKG